jgi:two-component system, chemotaxis family, CheB/CheR fusion protein
MGTLQPSEKQVKTTDQKWFLMRALPYRTSESRIDGLVVIFIDITTIKQLEKSIKAASNYAESIVATIIEPMVVLDSNFMVVSANRSFYMTVQR